MPLSKQDAYTMIFFSEIYQKSPNILFPYENFWNNKDNIQLMEYENDSSTCTNNYNS
jgi:hypothetical protein